MGDDELFQRWASDPDLEAASRRDRAERRAEAGDYERLGAQHLLRERRLGDVAVELLHRGDLVTVEVAGRRFTGHVVHSADDLVCLGTPIGDVDIALAAPLVLRVVERVAAGGRTRSGAWDSFKARLFAHEATGARVEVGTTVAGEALTGVVVAVARDHIVVHDRDGEAYVAISTIGYVRPSDGAPPSGLGRARRSGEPDRREGLAGGRRDRRRRGGSGPVDGR